MTLLHEFPRYRTYFVMLAYNILGARAEAEDIVQDVWARLAEQEQSGLQEIQNFKAYCTKAVINRALNRKKTMQREIAESYWGVWLPEPLVNMPTEYTSDEQAEERMYNFDLPQILSLGLLRLLEALTPQERAVYVLAELFDEPYSHIAELLDTNEAHCRKLLQRSKEKIAAGKQRFTATQEQHLALFQAFAAASQEGRFEALHRLLKDDVVMYSDGGGKVVAARIPVRGRDKVLLALANLSKWASTHEPTVFYPCLVNRRVGAVGLHAGTNTISAVLTLEADAEGITELYSVRNPDKIGALQVLL